MAKDIICGMYVDEKKTKFKAEQDRTAYYFCSSNCLEEFLKPEKEKRNLKYLTICSIIFILLMPTSFSDGGCVKVADDVFVQLSAVPIAPKVNEQASFLISFGNKDGLLDKRINGTLSIMKRGNAIFEKKFDTKGILSLKYTFRDTGFYEMYTDFTLNGKDYHPEDFAIEVVDNKKNLTQNILFSNIIFLIAGIAIGTTATLLIMRKGKK